MNVTRYAGALILVLGFGLASLAWGMKVPMIIVQQGQLLDATGNPLNGNHTMTVRLYEQPSGGTAVYTEIISMSLTDGLYTALIGESTPLTPEHFVDPNDPSMVMERYLSMEIDGDGLELSPRIRLVASPYAVGAHRVAGDFFSTHNQILMLDSATGDTNTVLASKKLFVGGLSWAVEAEAESKRGHLTISNIGSSGDDGVSMQATDTGSSVHMSHVTAGGDTTKATLCNDCLVISNIGSSGDDGVFDAGHDHLTISNIGSSGEDGVRFVVGNDPPELTVFRNLAVGDSGKASLGHDHLVVSNIGSSGEDGVRLALDNNEPPQVVVYRFPWVGDSSSAALGHDRLTVSNIGSSGEDGVLDASHDHLTISNIGSSGEDGVSIDLSSEPLLELFRTTGPTDSAKATLGRDRLVVSNIGSSGEDGFVMQHNQTDLDFVMRHAGSAPGEFSTIEGKADGNSSCWIRTAQSNSSGDSGWAQLINQAFVSEFQLATMQSGSSPLLQTITIRPEKFSIARTGSGRSDSLLTFDANGTATGPSLRLRNPVSGGPAGEVAAGDLNGDGLPDLAVSGRVGIGTFSPTEALHVVGNACATGGHITCSDGRFKKEIRAIEDPMGRLERLNGVDFQWRREEFPEQQFQPGHQVGFIAQEVQKVLPELVSEGSDGYLAMDYSRLTPLLVEAVKLQQKRIDQLEALVEQLAAERTTTQ